jgi:hypothetical protein
MPRTDHDFLTIFRIHDRSGRAIASLNRHSAEIRQTITDSRIEIRDSHDAMRRADDGLARAGAMTRWI